ncbi:MAG TPA: 50S ribosomal protein L16 [Nitrososphaerales archaeon]|nr:50S ribosomal protein L16 [Nitrososphaerales archaeon]
MKGKNYRLTSGMPLTSKVYSPGAPNSKIARFSTGQASPDYDYVLKLVSTEKVQIRHNALEAARVAANKKLTPIGETAYFLRVKVYPHVILRENRMIATAGADRLQEGMRKAWGKPMGLAARVMPGSVILELSVKKENLPKAKEAMRSAATKLPMVTHVIIEPLQKNESAIAIAT